MKTGTVVSRDEWLEARKALMVEEKQLTKARDALAGKRRELPWVRIDSDYRFTGPDGVLSFADLFGDHDQLIVQHFMMGEDWDAGCPSCSFWADGYDGLTVHIEQRDAAFVAVSTAPLEKIDAYRERMGWKFPWVSAIGPAFNSDFAVTFTAAQIAAGESLYNFGEIPFPGPEAPGISIFARGEDGAIYHCYSTYARGLDMMNMAYHYIDLLPKGRDEGGQGMAWLKRHDEYDTPDAG